jgi:hypothetical protein
MFLEPGEWVAMGAVFEALNLYKKGNKWSSGFLVMTKFVFLIKEPLRFIKQGPFFF